MNNRADEHYRPDYNKVKVTRPHQPDGNSQTGTQNIATNQASPEGGGQGERLAEISELTMHDLGKLVPTGTLEAFVHAGVLTNYDNIESLSPSPSTSSVSSFPSLLPSLGSMRPPCTSMGADSNKKCGHCHGMGTHEGGYCREVDGGVNNGLTAWMLSREDHRPSYQNRSADASAWFLERQQLTSAADSFLYLAELSSLSDQDGEEEGDNCHHMAEKQDDMNGSQGKKEKIDSKLHLLGHSRHKSLLGSEIVTSTAKNIEEDSTMMGTSNKAPTALVTDDCCNAPQYRSIFLHQTSSMENHGDRTRRIAMDHDPLVAATRFPPSTTLTSSTSLCCESLAVAPNEAFCATIVTATHQQKLDKEGSTGQSVQEVVEWRNECASFFVQQCKNKEEGRRDSGHDDHVQESTQLRAPVGNRRSQRILASTKKSKLNKASKNHDMDSSLSGKAMVDQESDDEFFSLCPPKGRIIYGDKGSQNRDKNHCAKKNTTNNKKEAQEIDPWCIHYQDLVAYKEMHGHCNVPFRYKNENPFLAAWVKRQRYQYKCKIRGKHSHLTDERERLLEELGFVWDSHVAAWEENFSALAEFYKQHGHCCVPIKQKELSDWAKRQRRLYKQKLRQAESCTANTSSTISEDRIRRLNAIEFKWATLSPLHAMADEASHKRRKVISSIGSTSSPYLRKRKVK